MPFSKQLQTRCLRSRADVTTGVPSPATRKIGSINQTLGYGERQKLMAVNLKERCVRLVIDGKRSIFQRFK